MVWFSNSLFARCLSCPSVGLPQSKQPRRQISEIQHPHPISFFIYFFNSKAGTEIAFQNTEILQETNWPFSILVRKVWAGREGSKQALHSWRSSLEVFAHQEQFTIQTLRIISDGRHAAINCFNNHGLLNILSAVVPEGLTMGCRSGAVEMAYAPLHLSFAWVHYCSKEQTWQLLIWTLLILKEAQAWLWRWILWLHAVCNKKSSQEQSIPCQSLFWAVCEILAPFPENIVWK